MVGQVIVLGQFFFVGSRDGDDGDGRALQKVGFFFESLEKFELVGVAHMISMPYFEVVGNGGLAVNEEVKHRPDDNVDMF